MATADKDGRIAQVVGDMHTCLSIALHEHVREAAADFEQVLPPAPSVDRDARQRAEQAMAGHQPCVDCVRCATCRSEWCPTVVERCPGEESWWMHPTGGGSLLLDDQAYCYKCTRCPGGYFQFHDPEHPACTEIVQEPHVVAVDGRGWE